MKIEYELHRPPFEETRIRRLQALIQKVFALGDWDDAEREDGRWRLTRMPDVTLFQAMNGTQLVGFKIGYAITSARYYSWLGGVDTSYRRHGIARELMDRQHDWISQNGYASVETGAQQDNAAMSRLNLASGFAVVGMRFKDLGPEMIYEKKLTAHPAGGGTSRNKIGTDREVTSRPGENT